MCDESKTCLRPEKALGQPDPSQSQLKLRCRLLFSPHKSTTNQLTMCPTAAAATGATPPPVPHVEGEVPSEYAAVSSSASGPGPKDAPAKNPTNPYGAKYADFLSNVSCRFIEALLFHLGRASQRGGLL